MIAVDKIDIDGIAARTCERPQTQDQLSAVLADANSAALAVIPVGGGTQLHWGNPAARADLAISLAAFDGVISHQAEDLVVTVQAGCPFFELQRFLARQGQRIPIDAGVAPTATIGGMIATNSYGPSRLRYG